MVPGMRRGRVLHGNLSLGGTALQDIPRPDSIEIYDTGPHGRFL